FDTALSLFDTHVNVEQLKELINVDHGSSVRTPTMFSYELFDRAAEADAHIVLPEGGDDRILRAASTLLARKIARLTILGNEAHVRKRAGELGLALEDADIIDPAGSPRLEGFAEEYARLRAHKGVTVDQ